MQTTGKTANTSFTAFDKKALSPVKGKFMAFGISPRHLPFIHDLCRGDFRHRLSYPHAPGRPPGVMCGVPYRAGDFPVKLVVGFILSKDKSHILKFCTYYLYYLFTSAFVIPLINFLK